MSLVRRQIYAERLTGKYHCTERTINADVYKMNSMVACKLRIDYTNADEKAPFIIAILTDANMYGFNSATLIVEPSPCHHKISA